MGLGPSRDGPGGKDALELTVNDFPALEKKDMATVAPPNVSAQEVKSPGAEKGELGGPRSKPGSRVVGEYGRSVCIALTAWSR